jgi:hypothetical protein
VARAHAAEERVTYTVTSRNNRTGVGKRRSLWDRAALVATQQYCKHISAAVNQHPTIEEAMFSALPFPQFALLHSVTCVQLRLITILGNCGCQFPWCALAFKQTKDLAIQSENCSDSARSHCPNGPRRSIRDFTQGCRIPSRDSNLATSKYKSEALSLEPTFSVIQIFNKPPRC